MSSWENDFYDWCATNCNYRDKRLWSIEHLHDRFGDWCVTNGRVNCPKKFFLGLLSAQGFICHLGLIDGLGPRQM